MEKFGNIHALGKIKLVAQTFIPNPSNLPQVNHKNGDKTDNRVENLEWSSGKQNQEHAVKNGFYKVGEKHFRAKLSKEKIFLIRKSPLSANKLSKILKVNRTTVDNVRRNKTWKHIK